MKIKPDLKCTLGGSMLCLAFFAGGCGTTPQASRIAAHPETFAQLTPAVQQEVSRGSIAKGFTPAMVFLALGRPDEVETAADGRSFVWIYRNFYPSPAVNSESLYYIPELDPIQEAIEMFLNNQSKFDQLSKPDQDRKQPGETWQDYAKSHQGSEALLNAQETRTYNNRNSRRFQNEAPEVVSMRLDVRFINQVVSDAVINETDSAFSPPPTKTGEPQ
ncbi:MAG: hypothetical protein K9M98_03850 [Cephaloticoccus sp.]|nr:hypothetical protein [Cephaloticoccus sp.]MCF7759616.1 hypothetical protein [Cephaloticoccus sp.]